MQNRVQVEIKDATIELLFFGELTLYTLSEYQKLTAKISPSSSKQVVVNLQALSFLDTAGAIYIQKFLESLDKKSIPHTLVCDEKRSLDTLNLVMKRTAKSEAISKIKNKNIFASLGEYATAYLLGFVAFMAFLGELLFAKLHYLRSYKNIRFKEIAFEINESSLKAMGIIALTSFLVGLVVAYQSAYQLKIYGANIFIVDMLGISILRELAPLMTAIVIAGRSGSAFSAQIGAMKITQELDAMRTMGFDPFAFLVMPRIIALMIMMPFLIFVADLMGVLGGAIVAFVDLGISFELFLERFNEVIAAKHYFVGLVKGPFFAFLIASIGIYRGLMVKDDTQSIGFNTTKSVVESIFAVIVCDAIFSIIFTNLGI